jgi:putative transposase
MRTRLSTALGVARSSSYYQRRQPAKDDALLARIRAVMQDNPAYGYERIAIALHEGAERIRRVKPWAKPAKDPSLAAELRNLIKETSAMQPSHIWAGDFTYLWFQGMWYYLATVLDLFTRELVGWQLGKKHQARLIHLAYCDALSRQSPPAIFHADQGSEYTAVSTKRLVELTGGRMSYSRKASPWQNGFQESFYGHFQLELGDLSRFEHEGELFEAIAKQIHYYNTQRIHTALQTNPVQFRNNYLARSAMLGSE